MQGQKKGGPIVTDGRSELPLQLVVKDSGAGADWQVDVELAAGKWVRAASGTGRGTTLAEARADAQRQAEGAWATVDVNALRAKHGIY